MNALTLLLSVVGLSVVGYLMGRGKAVILARAATGPLHSLPNFHGGYVALWCALPAFGGLMLWSALEPMVIKHLLLAGLPANLVPKDPDQLSLLLTDIRNMSSGAIPTTSASAEMQRAVGHFDALQQTGFVLMGGLVMMLALAGLFKGRSTIHGDLRARVSVEKTVSVILMISSLIAILATIGIVFSLIFESIRFFSAIPMHEFLFGLKWSPQTAIRTDQVGASGAFGAVPLFTGTLMVTFIAMLVAGPIGLMSAIYMAEYASPRTRAISKPLLEVLAGIPTVVYGFFAALTVAPLIRGFGAGIGLDVASESALAAGGVMGIMIIPFISSLSDDVINAVPQSLRDGSYALGATQSETILRVVLPAALPGIVSAFLLAISRAIGETMIVVMAAGLAANLTANPLQAVTTVTVQIVTLLVGDQEFDSPKTLAAFALGLLLFIVTLVLNMIALKVVRKYREKYD